MRLQPLPFVAVALAAALLGVTTASCSLTGLDRFRWPGCGECDVLNARDGIDPATACVLWQCAGESGLCERRPRDFDDDGHIALECDGTDCDDLDPNVAPDAGEVCNGVDDDCNDLIDDGGREPLPALEILAASTSPSWATYHRTADELVMAYETGLGAGLERIRETAPITTGSIALELASTSADFASSVSETAPGCAVRTATPFPLPLCADGGVCEGVEICVTSVGGDQLCGTPLSETPTAGKCNSHAECEDGIFCNGIETCQPASPLADELGCRVATPACTGDEVCVEEGRLCTGIGSSLAACGISDLAIAPAGDEWIAASITNAGCAAGSLRVGYFELMPRSPETRFPQPGTIVQRGDRDDVRGAGWLGIDLAGTSRCPGPGSGRAVGAPDGASGPSIAALPARVEDGRLRSQALVAYLAAPLCRALGTCEDAPLGAVGSVDVELVGLWLEEGFAGGDRVGWVDATGTGTPTRLGVLTSPEATRPQVLSWSAAERDGYLVAYPLAPGGIAVHVVAPLPDPAPVCDATVSVRPCVSDIDPHVTQIGTERRVTEALVIPAAQTLFASAEITGDVVVALHGAEVMPGAPLRLAFAWVEAARIAIARATFDPATGVLAAGDIEHVAASDVRELSIAYVARGMIGDLLRDGTPSDPSVRGGFVATWTEGPAPGLRQEHAWAARLSDTEGLLVPGAVRLTTELPEETLRTIARPHAFVDDEGLLRVVSHVDDSLVIFPSVCGTAR